MKRGLLVALVVTVLFGGLAAFSVNDAVAYRPTANTAGDLIPRLYRKCANLNAKYRHGVGRVGARDRVTSGDPVTNFTRNNRIYRLAMSYNKGLDRDKDFIACEKS